MYIYRTWHEIGTQIQRHISEKKIHAHWMGEYNSIAKMLLIADAHRNDGEEVEEAINTLENEMYWALIPNEYIDDILYIKI